MPRPKKTTHLTPIQHPATQSSDRVNELIKTLIEGLGPVEKRADSQLRSEAIRDLREALKKLLTCNPTKEDVQDSSTT